MALSLNVRFEGTSPPDPDDPHPPGAGIARSIEATLRQQGVAVDPIDDWRDAGWVVGHGQGAEALDIALAATGPQEWMLQVGPRNVPGLIATLLGRRPPDRSSAIHALAVAVDGALVNLGMTGLAWRWDGPPKVGDSRVPPPVSSDSGPSAA